ncbi:TonB-dependent receptor [Pseudoxanthomonas sp.]|uniref:TonB-dependent receptor n=1 Tax=Pseudoxanthomonas sp. TaxID=1871049 RepID=UPI002604DE2E|nr:TonB-dependent receptor [Pseudoxanthomonas sp.]WDS35034.1 MAG: TonB-dependent receptor [Pseudoxanthomonas sp.]
MNHKNTLAIAVMLALQWPVLAVAQEATQDDAQAAAQSVASTGKSEPRTLGQVTVTAERREENIQKTAVAISAVDGQQIRERGLVNIGDVLSQTPAVVMQNTSKGQSVFIRGVGSTGDAQEGGDPAVNMSLDGFYQQQAAVALANTLDVQRIEVLRGPQGTLYGRNSNAGSVNIITNDPVLGEFSGSTQLQLGNYNTVRTDAAINLPVNDQLAVRVAYATAKHDGYLSNGANAEDSNSARVKFLYEPSDKLKIRLTADHSRETGTPQATVPLPLSSSDPWAAVVVSGVQDTEMSRVYAQLDYDLGFATFSWLPGYAHTHQYQDSELLIVGASAQDTSEYAKSNEFRLVSKDSPVKWVAGMYYFNATDTVNPDPTLKVNATHSSSSAGDLILSSSESTTYALYGQATFPVTERLRLVTGGRYTIDDKSKDFLIYQAEHSFTVGPDYSASWHSWTWKEGLEYDLAEHSMLYAQASNGLKAGGINNVDGSIYEPEKITAFEAGIKNRFFDNRLQINASTYYYDYKNFQANLAYPDATASGGFSQKIQNAATARIYGGELETSWMPTTSDRFDLSVAYLHARFGRFVYTDSSGVVDRTGEKMPNSPTLSGLFSYSHYWDLASGASINARLDVRYSGKYDSSIDDVAGGWDIQSGFTRSDFSLNYTAASGRWGLRGYVRNIENKAQLLFSLVPNAAIAGAMVSDPRTYGVAVNVNF